MSGHGVRAVGTAPIAFEQWVEIIEAQLAAQGRGVDAAAVLAEYGLTVDDWCTIGAWWSQKLLTNADELVTDYQELRVKFRARFQPPPQR